MVAVCLEEHLCHFTNGVLILYQQNGFIPMRRGRNLNDGDGSRGLCLAVGQKDFECRPFSRLAFHFYPSLVLFDDPVNCGQPKTSAFANLLGGEKWLKNLTEMIRGNTTPCVTDTETNKAPRSDVRLEFQLVRIYHAHCRGDRQFATFGHGIASVDREVKENLLDHPAVRPHKGGRLPELHPQMQFF